MISPPACEGREETGSAEAQEERKAILLDIDAHVQSFGPCISRRVH